MYQLCDTCPVVRLEGSVSSDILVVVNSSRTGQVYVLQNRYIQVTHIPQVCDGCAKKLMKSTGLFHLVEKHDIKQIP